jgi:hypothetical protein
MIVCVRNYPINYVGTKDSNVFHKGFQVELLCGSQTKGQVLLSANKTLKIRRNFIINLKTVHSSCYKLGYTNAPWPYLSNFLLDCPLKHSCKLISNPFQPKTLKKIGHLPVVPVSIKYGLCKINFSDNK